MYLLFTSSYCRYSKLFVKNLIEAKEEKFFKEISVDKQPNGKRPEIVFKYGIKEVPTIIVDNTPYVGKDAFKWLARKIKNLNHAVSSQNTRLNKNDTSVSESQAGISLDGYSCPQAAAPGISGKSSFASFGAVGSPSADTPLPPPIQDSSRDKVDTTQSAFDKLQEEREYQNNLLKNGMRL
jgi:glutaredoxin